MTYVAPSRVDLCSVCGKTVQRSHTSRSEIICRPCRRLRRQIQCVTCGVGFEASTVGAKFCSRACSNRAPRDRETTRRGRTCEVCGAIYGATYTEQRTCGRICGGKLNARERPRPEPTPKWPMCRVYFQECTQCERVFASPQPRTRLCSDECRRARRKIYWVRDKRRPPLDQTKFCACGTAIDRKRNKCDACRAETRRRRRRREKNKTRDVPSESYTLAEIAERDRFRCGLCRKRVAMTKVVPHLKAPTIDHVVPIAVGGDDTRANVQLAHFFCNSLKQAGGSQQLALVG